MTAATPTLRAVTRGSRLALLQTEIVVSLLQDARPDVSVETVTVRTAGDENQTAPIGQIMDGAFVRGVEAALLDGRADLAVHSAKDVPTTEPPGLTLAAFPPRAAASDVLVSRDGAPFTRLSHGARLGTSSPRRAAVARALRPDLDVRQIRGNVDTRLRKLSDGEYDAIVLAEAGLARMDLLDHVAERLDPDVWVPPAGQGALAVQTRHGQESEGIVAEIDDPDTRVALTAERAALRRLGSGCSIPAGIYARLVGGELVMRGLLISTDGRRAVLADYAGPPEQAEAIGAALAHRLIERF